MMLFAWLLPFLLNTSNPDYPPGTELAKCDSLTVYVFLLDECVISQFYTPLLSDYYGEYKGQKVGFIGYFPNPASKSDRIEAFAKTYKIDFPLKQDYNKDLAKKFGVTVTPEVAVWDHKTETLLYRGRIDDSYVRVGKRKYHTQHSDLKDIIEDWLKGIVPDKTIETQAIGCFINFGKP